MSDGRSLSTNDSFSSVKQWLKTKFQIAADASQQNTVPKIVISRGSDKSINKMISPRNSPVLRRPSPLTNSWSNFREFTPAAPSSAPHYSSRSFYGSPLSFSPPQTFQTGTLQSMDSLTRNAQSVHSPAIQTNSVDRLKRNVQPLPSSTMQTNSLDSLKRNVQSGPSPTMQTNSPYMPVRIAMSENCTNKLKSPLLRFSQRNNIPISEELTPSLYSRSELDSESVCGACGQFKYYGSRDLIGFDIQALEDSGIQSLVSSPKFDRRQLKLRRTSSCRAPENQDRHTFQNSASITKAASNFDVQNLKRSSTKSKRVMRTGSKESNRSTISLTRSWSINLDSFRIVRNDLTKSHAADTRKMSLNDNELRRTKEDRRRSSILRLLCHETSDSLMDEKAETISNSDSVSVDEILEYSPKVTRATKFVRSDPVENFRSTFESDSIPEPSVYGQLKIMFQYFNEKNELQLTVLKGSNIAPGQTGTLGVYTKVCLMPGKLQKKFGQDKHDTKNPVFYEPFTFKMSLDEVLQLQLRIKLYNKPGIFSISEPIGECSVPLYHYDLTAVTVIWQNLSKSKGQKDDSDPFDVTPVDHRKKKREKLRQFLCGIGPQKTTDTEEN